MMKTEVEFSEKLELSITNSIKERKFSTFKFKLNYFLQVYTTHTHDAGKSVLVYSLVEDPVRLV